MFREGQLVIYINGINAEIGKIKTIKEHGAFVNYHSGETAALTSYDDLFPVINEYCIKRDILGGIINE